MYPLRTVLAGCSGSHWLLSRHHAYAVVLHAQVYLSCLPLMIVTVCVDPLPRQDAQPQPAAPLQPAPAAGSSSQDPKSGFVDVVMPREPDAAVTAAFAGPSDDKGPGADVQDARQDAAEPEATLPGGTATGVGDAGSDKSHSTARDAKQRRLDWSAAARGRKRKAGGGVQPTNGGLHTQQQLTRPPSKRQSKLKLVLSQV